MASPSIWLVGCGNMGGAMLRGWLGAGIDPNAILVIDPMVTDLPTGVGHVARAHGPSPDLLLLGIKPQMLDDVAPTLPIGPNTIVVSILAGVECSTLRQRLPGARGYARVMPNMPAAIGAGISAVFASEMGATDRALIEQLIAPLGQIEWIETEALFHAVTGVSGSGPAFVFRFIDALAAAGVAAGLDPALAMRLAVQTVSGSAQLVQAAGKSPQELAERVRSPNGTTHAGLMVMDGSDLNAVVCQTVQAAADRSRELAAAARQA